MANIPSIKKFRSEDFPSIDEKFLQALNTFSEATVNALSGNLNTVNTATEIFDRQLITKNTTVSAAKPIKLPWAKSLPPSSVVCGGLWKRGADSQTSLNLTIFIEWDYLPNEKQLLIKKINGLTLPDATYDYQITIQTSCK